MKIFYSFGGYPPLPWHLYKRLMEDQDENLFEFKDINLHLESFADGSIFVLHRDHMHIFNSLPEQLQNKIIECKNKSVVIFHVGYSLGFTKECGQVFLEILHKLNVEHKNIYSFVQTLPDLEFVKQNFPESKCLAYDEWAHEYRVTILENPQSDLQLHNKKFGLFIRRYSKNRLNFMLSILDRNLLSNFHYTFTNWAFPPPNVDIDKIINDIDDFHLSTPSLAAQKINWVKQMPYLVGNLDHDTSCAYPIELESYIKHSNLLLIHETSTEDNHPAVITEKTYKAIYHKKPFIIMGQKGALDYLRRDGYLTFHPYINETYDTIENYSDRLRVVLDEVERLSKLDEEEFITLLENVKNIVEQNYNIFNEKINKLPPKEFFFKNIG